MKQKVLFIIFEGLSLKQIKIIFYGRWESDFKKALNVIELLLGTESTNSISSVSFVLTLTQCRLC